jgi:colicin import membrane protein
VRGGLATSVVLHAAILAWALFTIQAQRELRMPEAEPIAVDLVSPSELTRLRQGARDAKQLEAQPKEAPKAEPSKKEAPKPTPVAAAPPPPPPPPPKEEPKEEPTKEVASLPPPAPAPPPPPAVPPVPAPDEQEKLNALLKEQEREAEEQKKAEELKKIEEQKRLEAERKQAELKKKLDEEKRRKEAELKKKREDEKKRKEAEAKKKQFDAENIAALLNKVPDKGAPSQSPMPTEPTKAKGPVLGAPEGRDAQISASERAVLAQIIRACVQARWNLSAGGEDAMNTVIKLRLQFRPDGTLSVPPQVTNQQNTPYFLAASEGAVRAAQACEPYSLPTEKYEAWRDVLMTFSLRDMLR